MVHEIIDFCDFWFGFRPYGYQREFLLSCATNLRVVGLWCRQSGKSTCIAMYSGYKCLTQKGFSIMMIAPTQEQSSELFLKVRKVLDDSELLKPLIKSSTQTEINFYNGSRIKALPCGPEGATIKGYTADVVIIEEAGKMKSQIVNEVITPMIASQQSYGQVIKIGTPKGKNHFYESCYGKETLYSVFHCDWRVVLAAGQYKKEFIEEQKANLTQLEFDTEYEAKFIEDADSYFKQELIDSCTQDYGLGEFHPKNAYVLGVDFARMGQDECVFIITERGRDGVVKVNFIDATMKKKLTESAGRIMIMDEKYSFERMYLDETGMGAGPTDMLSESLGLDRVEGMTFSVKSKQDMYSNLKKLMEDGKLQIPNNRKLLYQLADLRYEVASNGDLKIHHSERGHDDYPDALALACWHYKGDADGYKPFAFGR